ncbi:MULTISPECIES: hypothetical protein [Streptomyces]|nr:MULTISPECIES: hypothetical protein [Streptomyces]
MSRLLLRLLPGRRHACCLGYGDRSPGDRSIDTQVQEQLIVELYSK